MEDTRDSFGLLKRPPTPERPQMMVGLFQPLVKTRFLDELGDFDWSEEYEWMREYSPYFTQYDNLLLELAGGANEMWRSINYRYPHAKSDILMLLTFNHWDYVRFYNLMTTVEGQEEHRDEIKKQVQGLTKKEQRNQIIHTFEKGVDMEVPRMAYCCLALLLNELEDTYRLLGML